VVKAAIAAGITEIILVSRSGNEAIENYVVADLGAEASEPFKSVPVKGLVEKPAPKDAPSNLVVLGRLFFRFQCC
jgi:UTP--glucose-1-phosphate uridylyltransferase